AAGRPALASGVAPSDAVAGLRGVPDGGCTGPVLFRGRPDPGGGRVAHRVPRTDPGVVVGAGGAPYPGVPRSRVRCGPGRDRTGTTARGVGGWGPGPGRVGLGCGRESG